jgi:hypothetical protein
MGVDRMGAERETDDRTASAERPRLSLDLNNTFAEALTSQRLSWCRAKLLHALAGAASQGVLHEVLDELLDDAGVTEDRILRAMADTGWLPPQPPAAANSPRSDEE